MPSKHFSKDLILEILREIEKKEDSLANICRRYDVTRTSCYRWKKLYEDDIKNGQGSL